MCSLISVTKIFGVQARVLEWGAIAFSDPEELTKIIKQGGYQFFYVFFWKKTPPRTSVVTEEKSVLGFKKPS